LNDNKDDVKEYFTDAMIIESIPNKESSHKVMHFLENKYSKLKRQGSLHKLPKMDDRIVRIGRSRDMDLRLPYKTGSSFHWSIRIMNGGQKYYLKDESSTNGTFAELKWEIKITTKDIEIENK